jgi:hypothetical protein
VLVRVSSFGPPLRGQDVCAANRDMLERVGDHHHHHHHHNVDHAYKSHRHNHHHQQSMAITCWAASACCTPGSSRPNHPQTKLQNAPQGAAPKDHVQMQKSAAFKSGIRRNVAERVSHLMREKCPARTRQTSSAHDAMQRKLLHLLQPQRCAASLHEILRCFELYSGAAVHAVNLMVPETCYKKSLCEGRVAHMSVEAKAASSIARFAFFL